MRSYKWSTIATCPYCNRNQIVSIVQSTKMCIGCKRRFNVTESKRFQKDTKGEE